MNKRQTREFATIVDSREFLRRHRIDNGPFGAVVEALDDVITRVNALSTATHLSVKRSPHKTIRELSDELRHEHMIPISRRGKALFRGEARIENALRVPHARAQPALLVAAANAMIKRISPHRTLLIQQARFPRTFIADMRASAAKLSAAVKASEKSREMGPAVFTELQRQIARGRQEVRIADGLMLGWLRSQPPARRKVFSAGWRAAHRIKARLGRPSKRSPRKPPPDSAPRSN